MELHGAGVQPLAEPGGEPQLLLERLREAESGEPSSSCPSSQEFLLAEVNLSECRWLQQVQSCGVGSEWRWKVCF